MYDVIIAIGSTQGIYSHVYLPDIVYTHWSYCHTEIYKVLVELIWKLNRNFENILQLCIGIGATHTETYGNLAIGENKSKRPHIAWVTYLLLSCSLRYHRSVACANVGTKYDPRRLLYWLLGNNRCPVSSKDLWSDNSNLNAVMYVVPWSYSADGRIQLSDNNSVSFLSSINRRSPHLTLKTQFCHEKNGEKSGW